MKTPLFDSLHKKQAKRIDGLASDIVILQGQRAELLEALQNCTASLMHYMIEKEGAEKVSWILENSPASSLARARAAIVNATKE